MRPTLICIAGLLLVAVVSAVNAAGFPTKHVPAATPEVQATWTVPTTREDGTALPASELFGYELYYYCDGGETVTIPVAGGSTTSRDVVMQHTGSCVFAVAAIDTKGQFSRLSDAVTVVVEPPVAPPAPPKLTLVERIVAWIRAVMGWV